MRFIGEYRYNNIIPNQTDLSFYLGGGGGEQSTYFTGSEHHLGRIINIIQGQIAGT